MAKKRNSIGAIALRYEMDYPSTWILNTTPITEDRRAIWASQAKWRLMLPQFPNIEP